MRKKRKPDGGGQEGALEKVTLMTGLDYKRILTEVMPSQEVTIYTYDLFFNCDVSFYKDSLGHLQNCKIVVNRVKEQKRKEFETALPNVKLTVKEDSHAKILLIAPDLVYLTSQNFSDAPDWFQYAVRIKDADAYRFYYNSVDYYARTGQTNNIPQSREKVATLSLSTESQHGNYMPDYDGISLTFVDSKLASVVNWRQKLTGNFGRNILICTQTIPDMHYCQETIKSLLSRGNRVYIIAQRKSGGKLQELQKLSQMYPGQITCEVYDNLHAKMVLISPKDREKDGIVWLSSQNFGDSSWFEHTIRLKCKDAYEYYLNKLRDFTGHVLLP